MWKVRKKIVSVIIVALGTFNKGLDQNLQLLLSAVELQKITPTSTAHSTCNVLLLRAGLNQKTTT
jgi:hypothetical protein